MINPHHLTTFLELCKTRHFTKTANNLNMTQPGVSQHIKALEVELNVSLLLRRGKKVELSPAGENLLIYTKKYFDAEISLRNSLVEDTPDAGEINISCSGSMAILIYPKLLSLQEKHPSLKINLEAAPNQRSIHMLKQGESDIGLISSIVDDPELAIKELGSEQLCIAVPKGYSSNWNALLRLGYINHPNGAHYATQIFELNYPNQFTGFKDFPISGYINQINQILMPVAKGLGFTVLPESTVDHYSHQNLIEKGLIDKPCQETIYMITKKYKPLPKRYNQLIKLLEKLWSQ
ncbi:MAG: LysR family transcriptional regulator [Sneathiella sp.]|nr:LysR family transcriptional regulator [Sneathiella sp.]